MVLNNSTRKLNHELFISNHNGTTIYENYLLLTLPILLNTCISFLSVNIFQLGYGDIKGKLVINYLMVIMPFIFSITICSDYLSVFTLTVAIIAILLLCNSLVLSKSTKYLPEIRLTLHLTNNNRISWLYLSQMRGLILTMTAICILAVDMNIFPRRFAKTEMYGFGPMDLGVGLFSIIYGLLEQVRINQVNDGCKKFQSVGILLLLGIVRTIFVKYGNYQEHEGEYGTHWNFFLTMASLRLISIGLQRFRITQRRMGIILMIIGIIGFQYWLLQGSWSLERFCNDNNIDRTKSIFVANKEGLISLVGYILLWLIGRLLGAAYTKGSHKSMFAFGILSILTLCIFQWKLVSEETVSRRAANIGYIIWTSGSFCYCLILLIISDVLVNFIEDRANYVTSTNNSDLYCIVNTQAMNFFLLSNIFTGLINKVFDPLKWNSAQSISILVVYTATILSIIRNHNSTSKNEF